MITIKIIEAPSRKLADLEKDKKTKPKKEEKNTIETATYSTIIIIDGKYISLSVKQHLGYQKPFKLNHKIAPPKGIDLFEETFYWPIEAFTNPKMGHLIYKIIKESNYHYQSKLPYELNWEIIHADRIGRNILRISSNERSYETAIPPNDSDEPRYDYITDDCHYKYGCKPGEYAGRAIEIIVTKK